MTSAGMGFIEKAYCLGCEKASSLDKIELALMSVMLDLSRSRI